MPPYLLRLTKFLQISLDLLLVIIATYPFLVSDTQDAWLLTLAILPGMYYLGVTCSHYSIRRPFWDELRELLHAGLLMAGTHALLSFLLQASPPTLQTLLLAWLLATGALPLSRLVLRQSLRKAKLWFQPVILVGFGTNATEARYALECESSLGLRVKSQIHPHELSTSLKLHPHAVVAIALEPEHDSDLSSLMNTLVASGRDYVLIPALRGLPLQGLMTHHTFSSEVLLLRANNHLNQLPSIVTKRLFDVLGATLLLILLSPLLLGICLRQWREGGPILFWHQRVGRHGRLFKCPKFRTMVPDAEAKLAALLANDAVARHEWARHHKLKNDPRVTAFGRFLRESSLDELPQLLSVLKGDMSLVGPRPVTTAEMVHYGERQAYYEQVLPGITGLWQVSGRSDADYPTRVALDVWYVRNWSVWTDVVILLKTVKVVLQRSGAY